MEKRAIFAAGCFWGIEAKFRSLSGVIATRVGYTDGKTMDPTYKEVCTGGTDHVEAVEILYDNTKISYEVLLQAFWAMHDPTTLNRQGPDIGTQYRSGIYYVDDEQAALAESSKQKVDMSGHFSSPVVTEIKKATTFYEAEDYHQQYLEKRGQMSCGI